MKLSRFLLFVFIFVFCIACSNVFWGDSVNTEQVYIEQIEAEKLAAKAKTPNKRMFDEKYLKRGEYIVTAVAACGICHGAKPSYPFSHLSGGRDVSGVPASNITSDNETGIGTWSVQQIMDAFRTSISADGSELSQAAHSGYAWVSDADAKSIAVYLLASKPVRNPVEKGYRGMKLNPFSSPLNVKGYVPDYTPSATAQYGRYLTHTLANCKSCHSSSSDASELFIGSDAGKIGFISKTFFGSSNQFPIGGPNIRGISDLSKFFESGISRSGKKIDTRYCPQSYFKNLSDIDKQAISLYLKSL